MNDQNINRGGGWFNRLIHRESDGILLKPWIRCHRRLFPPYQFRSRRQVKDSTWLSG